MNPYETLEITSSATSEEIKEAYHRLAKKWHPDRFMGPEHDVAELRFRELNEAFSMIKNTGRPAVSPVEQPVTAPPPKEESVPVSVDPVPHGTKSTEDWFVDAKTAFETKNTTRALSLIEYALKLDPERVEFHMLLAQILDHPGGDTRKLIHTLETVLRLNPKEIKSAVRLAELYQGKGLNTKATRIWDTIRRLDPNHPMFQSPKRKSGGVSAQTLGEQFAALIEDIKGFFRRFKK